jgi:phosphate/sulfate permease
MPTKFFCSLPGTGVMGRGGRRNQATLGGALGVTKKILYAWIFTLPGAALLASLIYLIVIRFS